MAGHTNPNKVECHAKKPRWGGLNHLTRLLGVRDNGGPPADSVLLSLDLEIDESRQGLHLLDREPRINQIGIATLDTRELLQPLADLGSRISVHLFQVRGRKSKNQHSTVVPTLIEQEEVVPVITRSLRITDENTINDKEPVLRNIVIVGHSIWGDIKTLLMLGLDITTVTPTLAVLDTHAMSRRLFPPYDRCLPLLPNQDFTLAGVLAQFDYRPETSDFHNAANDAKYSLYAMLFLAVKDGMAHQDKLEQAEQANLVKLRRAISLIITGQPPATPGSRLREASGELFWDVNTIDDSLNLDTTTDSSTVRGNENGCASLSSRQSGR